MKAIAYTRYGRPEELQLVEIDRPEPRDGQVLVRVHAAGVNSWDWDLLRGRPFVVRLGRGVIRPRQQHRVLGADVAGQVVAVGRNVSRYCVGDQVFGDLCDSGWGAFAEYVCAPEAALTPKPPTLSYQAAAAVPQAAVMALQAIADYGKVQPGSRVLFNGAGGGIGTFAVQLAKHAGAEVTAVDRAEKLAMLSSLGVDHTVDCRRDDFTANGLRYDLIVDVVASRSIQEYRRALRPGGRCVIIGGSIPRILGMVLLQPLIAVTGDTSIRVLAHQPNKNLTNLAYMLVGGTIAAVVDRAYRLDQTAEALSLLGAGQVNGKVVISIDHSAAA